MNRCVCEWINFGATYISSCVFLGLPEKLYLVHGNKIGPEEDPAIPAMMCCSLNISRNRLATLRHPMPLTAMLLFLLQAVCSNSMGHVSGTCSHKFSAGPCFTQTPLFSSHAGRRGFRTSKQAYALGLQKTVDSVTEEEQEEGSDRRVFLGGVPEGM